MCQQQTKPNKTCKPNPLPMKSYHYCCNCGKVMFIIVDQIVYSNHKLAAQTSCFEEDEEAFYLQ